jgi:hypothetical protein
LTNPIVKSVKKKRSITSTIAQLVRAFIIHERKHLLGRKWIIPEKQPVEGGVAWTLNIKGPAADVVDDQVSICSRR